MSFFNNLVQQVIKLRNIILKKNPLFNSQNKQMNREVSRTTPRNDVIQKTTTTYYQLIHFIQPRAENETSKINTSLFSCPPPLTIRQPETSPTLGGLLEWILNYTKGKLSGTFHPSLEEAEDFHLFLSSVTPTNPMESNKIGTSINLNESIPEEQE